MRIPYAFSGIDFIPNTGAPSIFLVLEESKQNLRCVTDTIFCRIMMLLSSIFFHVYLHYLHLFTIPNNGATRVINVVNARSSSTCDTDCFVFTKTDLSVLKCNITSYKKCKQKYICKTYFPKLRWLFSLNSKRFLKLFLAFW